MEAPTITLSRRLGTALMLLLDLALIGGGFLLCLALRDALGTALGLQPTALRTHAPILVGGAPLLLLAFGFHGLYRIERSADWLRIWSRAAQAVGAVGLCGAVLLFFAPGYRHGFLYSRLLLVMYLGWLILAVGASRLLAAGLARRWWAKGRALRPVVLVGEPGGVRNLVAELGAIPAAGYAAVASLPLEEAGSDEEAARAEAELTDLLDRLRPEGAIFVVERAPFRATWAPLILACLERGLEAQIVTTAGLLPYLARRPGEICGRPAADVTRTPLYALKLALKRGSDVTLAAVALLGLAPLLLVLGLLVRLHDGGPALFTQQRAGRRGRRFRIFKLRTMRVGGQVDEKANVAEGPLTLIPDDPRVTRVGRWLRRHKLDELPQLVNVLLGQMSLVGPRPPLVEETARYTVWQRGRLAVRPGLTGLWQIDKQRKWRFDEMVELDLQYILNWSLLLDYGIMLRTVPAVLRGS